jgi:hypothetical protein
VAVTPSARGVIRMSRNSYLKEVKSHFEGNKRSKEYTAHQSKVRRQRGEIGVANCGVSRALVCRFTLLPGVVMEADWLVGLLIKQSLYGAWSQTD